MVGLQFGLQTPPPQQPDGREVGGGRLVAVRELIHEIYAGLEGTTLIRRNEPNPLPVHQHLPQLN